MADLLFPPDARVSRLRPDFISNTAASRSIFTGAARTVGRSGDRWRFTGIVNNASHRESYSTRAAVGAWLAAMRGQANRSWFLDPGYVLRGSFPATELLANNTFADGTTGWSSGSELTLSASDRMIRSAFNTKNAQSLFLYPSASAAVTLYASYVSRFMLLQGRGTYPAGFVVHNIGDPALGSSLNFGLQTQAFVAATTTAQPTVRSLDGSGQLPGDYVSIPYASLARCGLADNSPNIFTFSNTITNAAWSKVRCSANTDVTFAPDGTVTADQLVEDGTAANTHVLQRTGNTVSSAALDVCIYGEFRQDGRTACWMGIGHAGGEALAFFDLSNGTVGTTAAGTDWSNLRTFVQPLGNSWYRCYMVVRKSGTQTSLDFNWGIANPANTRSYNGDGAGDIYVNALGGAYSSLPVQPGITTSSALPTGTAQTGSAINVKGLPASMNGLLLPFDRVQVGTQLNMVTAPLNSDAAGLGYLQCAVPWRSAPADNAPVIIHQPMGRFVMPGNEYGYDDNPGGLSDFEFALEEALDL